jgi:hypothetical protein
MKKLSQTLLLLFILNNGFSQTWKLILTDKNGSNWFAQTTYVEKNDNVIKIWLKITNKTSSAIKK